MSKIVLAEYDKLIYLFRESFDGRLFYRGIDFIWGICIDIFPIQGKLQQSLL